VARFPDAVEQRRDALRRLYQFVVDQQNDGIQHTPNTLDANRAALGLTRDGMKALINMATQLGHLVEQPLPKHQRKGSRQSCLIPGSRP
jgi:hypothetical protein